MEVGGKAFMSTSSSSGGRGETQFTPKPAAPAAPPGPERTILIVEDDKVASRYLELSLSRMGGYRLEVAQDVASAMDILSNSIVDLVLTDIYLPDTDAFQFYRRARRESRFRNIPFIFVSSDSRVPTKVNALQLGIDDYITKPFDVQELRARIDAALQRQDSNRDANAKRRYNLAGDFTGISFTDLIYLLEIGRRNGTLSIVTHHASAELKFKDGSVMSATFGNLQGEEAFYRLMAEPEGVFEFTPGEVSLDEHAVPITMSSTALLLEGARRKDDTTRIHDPLGIKTAPVSDAKAGEDLATAEMELEVEGKVPATKPTPALAGELEEGLSDAFSLGELQLFTEESLREWTRQTSAERLHILLVADLEEGVSSLMSLAAPITDSQIYSTLTTPIVTLGLVFYLRKERVVDIVLVDQESPSGLLESLGRHPGIIIVAPKKGDFLSLGVKPHVGLVSLLQTIPPLSIVALGNASVDDGLAQIQAQSKTSIPVQSVRTALGEAGADLRQVILSAIKFWSGQETAPAEE